MWKEMLLTVEHCRTDHSGILAGEQSSEPSLPASETEKFTDLTDSIVGLQCVSL